MTPHDDPTMTLEERLDRSRSSDPVDFMSIACEDRDEPLMAVRGSDTVRVEPIWEVEKDVEGRLYAAYIQEHPDYDEVYVREGLAERLLVAAGSLPDGLRLVVHAGHRPIAVQERLLTEVAEAYRRDHPGASDEDALTHARTYVSDPAVKLPPHCCGAAVDVELYDVHADRLVDFGSPVNEDAEISHLHHEGLTAEQRASRMLLLRTMLAAGFASYHAEWWHYSYGDQLWAWFYRRPACLYGLAEV